MLSWITAIPGAIGSLFGLAEKGLDYYIKRADGDTQKAIKLMEADQARIAAQRDITIAGMAHPVWWMGWALFVFPLGIYWTKVLVWDKVLGWGVTPPLGGFVLEWAGTIILYLFGLQVGVGIVGSIINRVVKR